MDNNLEKKGRMYFVVWMVCSLVVPFLGMVISMLRLIGPGINDEKNVAIVYIFIRLIIVLPLIFAPFLVLALRHIFYAVQNWLSRRRTHPVVGCILWEFGSLGLAGSISSSFSVRYPPYSGVEVSILSIIIMIVGVFVFVGRNFAIASRRM